TMIAISGDGNAVVGYGEDANGVYRAIRWTPAEGLVDMQGGDLSWANSVSADGSVIVGARRDANGRERAFRWTFSGGFQDLGTLGGSDSWATYISADGSIIVGDSHTASGQVHTFRWTAATGMTDLGALAVFRRSEAGALSADGRVAVGGSATSLSMLNHAYIWTPENGLNDLGALLGDTLSYASFVSIDGTVVAGTSGSRPFRWTQESGMADLGLSHATVPLAMSQDGSTLVGRHMVTPGSGDNYPFRWTQTEGLMLLGGLGEATAVSADGSVVVGQTYGGRGFRWTTSDGVTFPDIPQWGVTSEGTILWYCPAQAVSADGSVVIGNRLYPWPNFGYRPYRWTAADGATYIPTPDNRPASALGISADGSTIYGIVDVAPQQYHAFVWSAAMGFLDVGTLGSASSFPRGISADGTVLVGRLDDGNNVSSRGFRWTLANGISAVESDLGSEATGWHIGDVVAVSADGQTLHGNGINPQGTPEAWVATLDPNGRSVTVQWNHPQPIQYGEALSAAQLNATVSFEGQPVAGSITYVPPVGTVLNAGTGQKLTAYFTPDNPAQFFGGKGTVSIDVTPLPSTLTWPNPASLIEGMPLGPNELNATASVPGTFTYTPTAGTALPPGSHELNVSFVPDDPNYSTVQATAFIEVLPIQLSLTYQQYVAAPAGSCSATVLYSGSASAGGTTLQVSFDPASGSTF
ncbi:hypothetical protein EG829_14155, partial [bacterium]|nr:hypothetical protein [bacterium]